MRTATRFAVPTVTAAALVGGAFLLPGLANAQPELPPATAAELLADLAASDQQAFSGTVVQTTDLGLPELPSAGPEASELTTLLAGSTTLRLWNDGDDSARVAVLGALAETDVVRDGEDVWVWRSDNSSAVHTTLPEGEEKAPEESLSPQDAADRALAAIDPSTEATVDGTATVAGRDAYELVLTPRDGETLVGEVRLAVDAATSFPLRVQVLADGADQPAFETGFTSISFDTPGDEVFAFSPPAGVTVEELQQGQQPEPGAEPSLTAPPTVVGEGWTSVAVVRGFDLATLTGNGTGDGGEGEGDAVLQTLLDAFQPVEGDYGTGRVFTSSLLSVLALDDGRLLVGAVPAEALEAAALDPAAQP